MDSSKLSRRQFMSFALGTVLSTQFVNSTRAQKKLKTPNILWISCEDISQHLGCFGEKNAITPNIDRFARESVRCTRAFTVHGVCAPSRSGIITGMYPSSLGSVNMRCRALLPGFVKCFPEYLQQAGYYCTNNAKEDYNFHAPKTAWHESSNKAHWQNRSGDEPFFAVFNFLLTHESRLWGSKDFDNTHPEILKPHQWQKPENMNIPPIYPDTLGVRRDFARLFERITEFDYFVKRRIDEIKQAGLYDDTIIFVWSDHGNGLPRAKRWLYDSGTLSPLMVRVPEKFRIGNQAVPGSVDDRLVNFIDLGPTVLNLAGLDIPKHMQGRPFLGPNLPPEREYIFGARQRIDERFDMVHSVRNKRFRYIRNFNPWNPYFLYLAYRERCNTMKELRRLYSQGKLDRQAQQLMALSRPAEEFYDLEADPFETDNLIAKAKYDDIKDRLKTVLEDWMIRTRDTGLIPEPELIKRSQQSGSAFEVLHRTNSEKLVRKLLTTANIASSPKPFDRPRLYKTLQDPDPAVRYWAVTAIGQLKEHADLDFEKIETAVEDKSETVRIAAARSLHWMGKSEKALEILIEEIKENHPDQARHFAMVVLDEMQDKAKPALEEVQKILSAKPKYDYFNRVAEYFVEKLKKNTAALL